MEFEWYNDKVPLFIATINMTKVIILIGKEKTN